MPANSTHLGGTVHANSTHLGGTLKKKVEVFKIFPNSLKAPLSAVPKVPEFCAEVEGNPFP